MASIGTLTFVEHVDSTSPSALSFGRDKTRMACVFDVDFESVLDGTVVKEILGYSTTGNAPLIRRYPPMKCPLCDWLYATEIASCQFLNPTGNDTDFTSPAPFATYEKARLTVIFETLPYDIITDDDMASLGYTDEFYRWCWRKTAPNVEQAIRPGNMFTFANGPAAGTAFPQGVVVRSSKRVLNIKWFSVPALCVLSAATEPWNFEDQALAGAVGRVNNATWHGYRRGEVLLLPSVAEPRTEPVPPELLGLPTGSVPRCFDYDFHFAIFQPDYDPTELALGNYYAFGWQTFPPLTSSTTNYHYQAARNGAAGVTDPTTWLYPEVDFTGLFQTLM